MKNEKVLNQIAMLQYQIERYRATGNGTMCQMLNARLRRLSDDTAEKDPATKK